MLKNSPVFLFLLTFLCICLSELSFSSSDINVRVAITQNKDSVEFSIKGPYRIEAINSDRVLERGLRLGKSCILPTALGVKIGNKEYKVYGIRITPKSDATIYVDGSRFRGIVDIIRTDNKKLLVINHINIEKYLYGVLYHETPHYWPMEVLKAQAVAARTYAIYRKGITQDKDYDVTSDIYSQVYGGHASERGVTKKAVDSTKGCVLVYDGKIVPAYYHSICAGHTEDAENVFEINLPPLKGVKCPYCKDAKGFYWKASFSYKQIEKKLSEYGEKVKNMKGISEGKRDRSGRLEEIKIKDSEGWKVIKGFKFRLALGPNVIKSTNFTIEVTPEGVIFKGKGWGHGVGMCQWGALGMARSRHNHKDILKFYYPKAEIKKYDEAF